MKQTFLKKVLIACDYREKEISEILKKMNAEISIVNLPFGDFVISDKIVIERKKHGDFISSIIDGRIFEQIKKMRENFEKVVLIIEGFSDRKINENALKGTIASLLLDEKISIVNTLNENDSAKTIYWIAKKERQKQNFFGIKIGKKGKEVKEMKEKIVASLPGIGMKTAKKLLKHFKTVKNVFCASENELMKIKGIGKKIAKKIKDIIESSYE